MGLIQCTECGGQVSELAAACPNCGAPPLRAQTAVAPPRPKGPSLGLVLSCSIVGLIVAVPLWSEFHSNSTRSTGTGTTELKKTPEQLKQEEAEKSRNTAAVIGALMLRKSMRDPESFRLENVTAMGDSAACYTYRANNGFGGMNVEHSVLQLKGGKITRSGQDGFNTVWNKFCGGKTGDDITTAVKWGM